MTPRDLRDAIRCGRLTTEGRKPPAPPPEWSARRQERLQRAIRSAYEFVVNGRTVEETRKKVDLGDITKQRCQQYIIRGIEFLNQRGYFVPVGNGFKPIVMKRKRRR